MSSQLEKVKVFVEALNRRKEEKEEQQKIEGIKERIESYSVLPSVSNNTNDQINQVCKLLTSVLICNLLLNFLNFNHFLDFKTRTKVIT